VAGAEIKALSVNILEAVKKAIENELVRESLYETKL
jgi:hypothetical protein